MFSRMLPQSHILLIGFLLSPSSSLSENNAGFTPAQATPSVINIGVLAFRSKEKTLQKWDKLAKNLSASIPNHIFNVVPLNYPKLEAAITEKTIDFVLTNPGHYVKLEALYNITRLATLVKSIDNTSIKEFGAVIFSRIDRSDINSLEDLRGKSFAAVKKDSLGGFMAAYGELLKRGIEPDEDFSKLQFSGMPHDQVVFLVKSKQIDAGTVRTGVLESLANEGIINLSDFKILNRQLEKDYPFVYSTQLYPEWPFSKLGHSDDALAKKVAIALLTQPAIQNKAKSGEAFAWAVPLNYTPVHNLMKTLRLPPYEGFGKFSLIDVAQKYLEVFLLMVLGTFLIVLLVMFKSIRRNRLLTLTIIQQKHTQAILDEEKELLRLTLESIGDAVITTDANGVIDYINPVVETSTGYTFAAAVGQPLSNVLHIVNEHDRQPRENMVSQCLKEGKVVDLGNHTILTSRSGEEYSIQISAAPIRGRDGKVLGVIVVFSDVTEQRRLTKQMVYQASHDSLTELVNRREFDDRLQLLLEKAKKTGSVHALCYLDLDQFKVVNDTCGHVAGDELLRQIAIVLHQHIRARDTLARLGGDEFGILMEHCTTEQAKRITDTLRQAIGQYRFVWEDKIFNIGASLGVMAITETEKSAGDLLMKADTACYAAKRAGRNRTHVYQTDDAELTEHQGEMQWVSRINHALENNHLCLYFQPIRSLNGIDDLHYELLIRMKGKNDEIIAPGAFMPAAERYGLTTKIDCWVIRTAFHWLNSHPEHLEQLHQCTINLSGCSLGSQEVLTCILKQFNESNVIPETICLEITETAAIANLRHAIQFIEELRSQGCHFALDDFGSGLSSFAYLKNLAVDYLKIDGVFVKNIVKDPTDQAMVKSINEIGHAMGKQTIAEFAEDDEIIGCLSKIGVDFVQGFGVAHPRPIEEIKYS